MKTLKDRGIYNFQNSIFISKVVKLFEIFVVLVLKQFQLKQLKNQWKN